MREDPKWNVGRVDRPVPFSLRGGSLVAMPTPFADGQVDEKSIAALCARQIAGGTSAIVVCATTGEAPSLSHAEQRRVIEVAVRAVDGRIPVIAGAGTSGTAASIELACQAEDAGAAALLCVTPYYVRPTQEGIFQHMRAIHDAVNIPLILYDVPTRTGCALADDTVVRLAGLPRVVGLKDATGDLGRLARLRARVKGDFLLLSGDDVTQAEHRRAGGDGCISVTANVAPRLCAQMHAAWDTGDVQTFEHLAEFVAPLSRVLFVETNPIPVKHALHQLGLISNELRLPLLPLSAEHRKAVQAALDATRTIEKERVPANDRALPGFMNSEIFARALAPRNELTW